MIASDPVCLDRGIPEHLHSKGKPSDDRFESTEALYRRFRKGTAGIKPPITAFTTREMSVVRAKHCQSEVDALYNCDSDEHFFTWAIAELSVLDIENICLIHPTEKKRFTFKLVHRPEQCWYPHSEVWVFADGERTSNMPGSLKTLLKDMWSDSCDVVRSSDPPG